MTDQDASTSVLFKAGDAPGTITTAVVADRLAEWEGYELTRRLRTWTARGVISESIPMFGNLADVLRVNQPPHVRLKPGMKTIYVQHGQKEVSFFDLIADSEGRWIAAEVQVEVELPGDALLFAREPINRLIDVIALKQPQPIVIQRIELLSPIDQAVMGYEVMVPYNRGLILGQFAGMLQPQIFVPIDAILREAVAAQSPFYRLLCAFRAYDCLRWLRTELRRLCTEIGVAEQLPKETRVDPADLVKMGISKDKADRIKSLRALFEAYSDHRNGIAHFLVDGGDVQSHWPLGDGESQHDFALASSLLLRYLSPECKSLRNFYMTHLDPVLGLGSILPLPENRHRFVVKPPPDVQSSEN